MSTGLITIGSVSDLRGLARYIVQRNQVNAFTPYAINHAYVKFVNLTSLKREIKVASSISSIRESNGFKDLSEKIQAESADTKEAEEITNTLPAQFYIYTLDKQDRDNFNALVDDLPGHEVYELRKELISFLKADRKSKEFLSSNLAHQTDVFLLNDRNSEVFLADLEEIKRLIDLDGEYNMFICAKISDGELGIIGGKNQIDGLINSIKNNESMFITIDANFSTKLILVNVYIPSDIPEPKLFMDYFFEEDEE